VQFDEYTEDILENRLIKASLRRLASLHLNTPALRGRVLAMLGAMELVSDQPFSKESLPRFSYTRLNAHYRPAVELATLIIENFAIDLAEGKRTVSGLLFDMNKVFEDFVFGALKLRIQRESGPTDRWLQGARLSLDREGLLNPEPDLSWWRGQRCVFVGDAKYKYTANGSLGDLYQVLAYCIAANVPSGLLIYAEQPRGPVRHQVAHNGPALKVQAIDVSAPIASIEIRIDELAAEIKNDALGTQLYAAA
jgi:5-methylcytosine-specific restriction enzyme subunit McrC